MTPRETEYLIKVFICELVRSWLAAAKTSMTENERIECRAFADLMPELFDNLGMTRGPECQEALLVMLNAKPVRMPKPDTDGTNGVQLQLEFL
jgi:hypothetical protein